MTAEHEPDYSQVPESFTAGPPAEGLDDEAARHNELIIRGLSQQLLLRVHDGVVCYVRRSGDEFEVAFPFVCSGSTGSAVRRHRAPNRSSAQKNDARRRNSSA